MKRFVIAVACMLGSLWGGTASAGMLYPIAPPGSTVSLEPRDFIQSVPDQTFGLLNPNPVIGDNIGQHPGAFRVGFPPLGSYFVGVFGAPIDLNHPDNAVYLWETSNVSNDATGFLGPQIQLGYWNGLNFTGYGITQNALYKPTGVLEDSFPDPPFREITSSVTFLKDLLQDGMGNQLDYSLLTLNAVKIEVTDVNLHNQVTAVAVNTVPEPASIAIWGLGAIGVGLAALRKKKLAATV